VWNRCGNDGFKKNTKKVLKSFAIYCPAGLDGVAALRANEFSYQHLFYPYFLLFHPHIFFRIP